MTLYETLRKRGKEHASKTAFIEASGHVSYAGFWAQVEERKAQLQKIGVQEKDAIGILFDNSSEFMVYLLAGVGLGAVVMPLSVHFKSSELQKSVDITGLNWVIADDNQQAWQGADFDKKTLSDHVAYASFAGQEKLRSKLQSLDNPAFMRYTSGTTGFAKGVVISQQAVLERINAANKGLELMADDRVLWVLPMAYHFMVSMILYLERGLTLIIAPDFTADTLIGRANAYRATMLYASPFHIRLLSAAQQNQFQTLKKVISTSAGLSPAINIAFKNRYDIPVMQAYGIIEIGLPMINSEDAAEHPEAVGRALPDYEVTVLDEKGIPKKFGEAGHLAIKGPGLFSAYLEPFTPASEVLQDGYFMTGDIATIDETGLVRIQGRLKSMINVAGNKVFPEEIEGVLQKHEAVDIAKAEKAEHPLLGEIVKAKIIIHPDKVVSEDELLDFCKSYLSSFKIPRQIEIVDQLDFTDSGKIKRH